MSSDLRKMYSSRIGFRVVLLPTMSNKNYCRRFDIVIVCVRESMIEMSCSSRNVQPEFHVLESGMRYPRRYDAMAITRINTRVSRISLNFLNKKLYFYFPSFR